eukprot:Skav208911  [mRNA]  locus=scaffold270:634913:636019:- [translate_table: standard]
MVRQRVPPECTITTLTEAEGWSLRRMQKALNDHRNRCSQDEELLFHYASARAVKEILADSSELHFENLKENSPLDLLQKVLSNLSEADVEAAMWKDHWIQFRRNMLELLPESTGREADAVIIVKREPGRSSLLAAWKLAPRKMTTIVIGNPRVGKSALLNHLVGSTAEFESGVTDGGGLTRGLQEFFNEADGKYYADTPGFYDVDRKHETAQVISNALKEDGEFRLVFMIQLPGGGFQNQDLALIALVLDALSRLPNIHCGIIINKVFQHEWSDIKSFVDKGSYSKQLNQRCPLPHEEWTPRHFHMVPAREGSRSMDEVFDGVETWVHSMPAIDIQAALVGEISAISSSSDFQVEHVLDTQITRYIYA